MNYKYVFNDGDAESWFTSYKTCLKNLHSAETLNETLNKKISELEDKIVKLEANQLYNTLCLQGNHAAAKIVWAMIQRL
jgi:hypothetical protein